MLLLTSGPVLQNSTLNGFLHQGQFEPATQFLQGFSELQAKAHCPRTLSGQKGGKQSHLHSSSFQRPFRHPVAGGPSQYVAAEDISMERESSKTSCLVRGGVDGIILCLRVIASKDDSSLNKEYFQNRTTHIS